MEYIREGGGGRRAKKVSFTAYSLCRLQILLTIYVQPNGIQTNLKKEIHLRAV